MLRNNLIAAALLLCLSCAQPPDDVQQRINQLREQGDDKRADAIIQEINVQEGKAAIFRSYARTKELLQGGTLDQSALEVRSEGMWGSVRPVEFPSIGVICFVYEYAGKNASISCVKK